ncbi:lycopene beta-cyclase CrtY [Aurantiacibacter aquimixticola]|uniref:Lycopene cyclase n=1 Tax=Aurantiacibacter aquimixticola TaxID=1958945 RepID=A0A419RVV8_9SPHN|nr:lycopene beta-cyclase CrtY [Aurantiacibacter aquimixticola]RJY09926.1 lycopene cyclase [Aurantiacibacter aquimixticola]
MEKRDCDIAIVGGGLSGGLIALALHVMRPDLSLRVLEGGPRIGGNHRWSWFASDLSAAGEALMAPFRKAEWDSGYDVRFPDHTRTLSTDYRSLASEDFAAALERELPAGSLHTGTEAAAVEAKRVLLRDGSEVTAQKVIDCRGFATTGALRGGWQVFMGRRVRTDAPHGIERPVIMDATVDQHAPAGNGGAYRFVYVLPLGAHDVFVEDTYYADSPALDRNTLSGRIDQYCRAHDIAGEPVGHETGVLPVITGGDFGAFQEANRISGVAVAGARGGFVHPLTSYTLPVAVEVALLVAKEVDLPGDQLAAKLEARARRHWRSTRFYRALGRMLFQGARPRDRYRIFARFYRLAEPLIERFYSGRSTLFDKARVLSGKPPIPIHRGVKALLSSSPSLQSPQSKDHP